MAGDTKTEVFVPYISEKPFLTFTESIGWFRVELISNINTPTATDVEIRALMWVAAGEDWHLGWPGATISHATGVALTGDIPPRAHRLRENDDDDEGSDSSFEIVGRMEPQSRCIPQSSSAVADMDEWPVFVAEPRNLEYEYFLTNSSVGELCVPQCNVRSEFQKNFKPFHEEFEFSFSDGVAMPDELVTAKDILACYYPNLLVEFNGLQTVGGVTTIGLPPILPTIGAFGVAHGTPQGLFSSMFLFSRGSVRHKLTFQPANGLDVMTTLQEGTLQLPPTSVGITTGLPWSGGVIGMENTRHKNMLTLEIPWMIPMNYIPNRVNFSNWERLTGDPPIPYALVSTPWVPSDATNYTQTSKVFTAVGDDFRFGFLIPLGLAIVDGDHELPFGSRQGQSLTQAPGA